MDEEELLRAIDIAVEMWIEECEYEEAMEIVVDRENLLDLTF